MTSTELTSLPYVSCRIFQFENFARTKKRVLSQEADDAVLVRGWYTLHIYMHEVYFSHSVARVVCNCAHKECAEILCRLVSMLPFLAYMYSMWEVHVVVIVYTHTVFTQLNSTPDSLYSPCSPCLQTG